MAARLKTLRSRPRHDAATHARSEHRVRLRAGERHELPPALEIRPPSESEPEALAALLLAAYRGTVDDEGEDAADAQEAITYYLGRLDDAHSVVLLDDGVPVCMAFVVTVDRERYIDPVVTAPHRKRHGLGRAAVARALASLASAGERSVGAVITDGNVPSLRLFASLGFERIGPWPRPARSDRPRS